MNHETLKALFQLDVDEVGEEEAAKWWECYSKRGYWVDNNGSPSWFEDAKYRRKPGIPWPKVMQQSLRELAGGTKRDLIEKLNQQIAKNKRLEDKLTEKVILNNELADLLGAAEMKGATTWPNDAPEWANYMLVEYLDKVPPILDPFDRLIERPKPAKQKIDWAKLPLNVHRHMKQEVGEGEPLSDWIAWNCDEHTSGNPLPDGLVVEWWEDGEMWSNKLYTLTPINWSEVRAFRIVGVQENFE